MKIKLLKGVVVNKQPHPKGSEVEVSARDGRNLILSGRAIEVESIRVSDSEPKKRGRPKKFKAEE